MLLVSTSASTVWTPARGSAETVTESTMTACSVGVPTGGKTGPGSVAVYRGLPESTSALIVKASKRMRPTPPKPPTLLPTARNRPGPEIVFATRRIAPPLPDPPKPEALPPPDQIAFWPASSMVPEEAIKMAPPPAPPPPPSRSSLPPPPDPPMRGAALGFP